MMIIHEYKTKRGNEVDVRHCNEIHINSNHQDTPCHPLDPPVFAPQRAQRIHCVHLHFRFHFPNLLAAAKQRIRNAFVPDDDVEIVNDRTHRRLLHDASVSDYYTTAARITANSERKTLHILLINIIPDYMWWQQVPNINYINNYSPIHQ